MWGLRRLYFFVWEVMVRFALFCFALGPAPVRLCLCASEHKWLGWLWSTDGGATESLHARLRAASSKLCVLAGATVH